MNFSLSDIIGISTTCVLTNSTTSFFYRRHEKFLPVKTIIPLAVSIIIGTVSGSYISEFAFREILLGIFIAVNLFSIYIINNEIYFNLKEKKIDWLLYIIFACIGGISASIGIGGAAMFTPALKCFLGKETKELIPTVTILVLVHAFFAFSSKFVLGHITLMIIPVAFLASLIGSKIGVIISHKLTCKTLNILLTCVLILALIKIIIELILG